MLIKRHLSGICVAYPEHCGGGTGQKLSGLSDGRPQGSLYSGQKKRIADALTRLQQVSRYDCRPLIFVATTPGYTERANESRFVSRFVDYLRKVYKLERYVWVREFTKAGFPHFHFVANIPINGKSVALQKGFRKEKIPFDPVHVSRVWSSYFDREDLNSIRVGSRPNKRGERKFFLSRSNRRMAWYLAKYIGKSRGQDDQGKRVRTFAIDEKTNAEIEPQLFQSKYVQTTKVVATWNAQKRRFEDQVYDIPTGDRIFEDENGNLFSPHAVDWRSVGHDVYVGFERD